MWGLSQNKSIRMPDTNAPSNECSEAFFNKGAVDKVRKSRANPQLENKRHVGRKQPKKRRRPATVKGNRRKHGPNVKVERKPRKTE